MGNVGKMESRVDGFVKVESTVEGPYRGKGWMSHVTGGAGWGRERDLGISGEIS